jgi:NADH dehydrogenase
VSAGGRPRVVVVGAGFGGLAVVQRLARADVEVTLVDRHNYHLFQPLLYQVASAVLDPSDIAHPVRGILRRLPNCDFVLAEVTGADLERRVLRSSAGEIPYDRLVLATGSANSYFGMESVAERAYGLKDLGQALALRARVLDAFERASRAESAEARRSLLTFAVIGAGPTGVGYAGALSELVHHVLDRDFRRLDTGAVQIVLIEATGAVLGEFAPGLGRRAVAALRRKGVRVLLHRQVAAMEDGRLRLADGTEMEAATVIWTAGVAAERPGGLDGVPTLRQRRVPVSRDTLEVPGHPGVHAIGDLAACPGEDGNPLPMLAPVAIQQGRHVARVIEAAVRGTPPPPPFRYWDKGTIGDGRAQRRRRPDRAPAALGAARVAGLAICGSSSLSVGHARPGRGGQ